MSSMVESEAPGATRCNCSRSQVDCEPREVVIRYVDDSLRIRSGAAQARQPTVGKPGTCSQDNVCLGHADREGLRFSAGEVDGGGTKIERSSADEGTSRRCEVARCTSRAF